MDKKDSFIFYRSFYEAIRKLKKNDQLTVYSQICKYALGEETEEIDGVAGAIFDLVKPQIDANLRRYENGKKGGRPKTETEPNHNLDITKVEPNVNVNVNGNVNENVNVNANGNGNVNDVSKTTTTTRPTLDQLSVWCSMRGIKTNVEKFYAYNDARGWTLNGKPADWQKLLQLWIANDTGHKGATTSESYGDFDYDWIERELVNR